MDSLTIKIRDDSINYTCAITGQGKLFCSSYEEIFFLYLNGIFINLVISFVCYSGNVVGVQPYAVGTPSCSNHGMYPSSRYSGLCVSTQTIYTPNNQVITQNTYTFKSERINPTVYRTINTQEPSFNPYATSQTTAVQAYQQALQAYENPSQSFEQAQQNYQLAIQAYNRAYGQPQPQPQTQSYSYSQPTQNSYNWSAYFG